MLRYRLLKLVTVSLEATDPNASVSIEYDPGDTPDLADLIRRTLTRQYGAFGHLIGENTTPIDLTAAMNSPAMQYFQPVLIEGEGIVTSYDPGIPPGAIT
jgi:hypothetical protein